MVGQPAMTLYRVVKTSPPTEADYETHQDRLGKVPSKHPEHVKRSWDALSSFDSLDGALRLARAVPKLGDYIAQFDIPEGIGVTWEQSGEEGHYDLRGDKAALRSCFVGIVAEVPRPAMKETNQP